MKLGRDDGNSTTTSWVTSGGEIPDIGGKEREAKRGKRIGSSNTRGKPKEDFQAELFFSSPICFSPD